ncbi:MAG: hypothetical protein V4598_00305 [Bdellovibrionota bacterium]
MIARAFFLMGFLAILGSSFQAKACGGDKSKDKTGGKEKNERMI